jgi:uncharacterized membrane protein
VSSTRAKIRAGFRIFQGLVYIGAGLNHFITPSFYHRIMPPYMPAHSLLINISGVAEIILGAMLIIPKTTKLGAWGLIALLIAVWPANIHMALNPAQFADLGGPVFLWIRAAVMQIGLMLWAYGFTHTFPDEKKA